MDPEQIPLLQNQKITNSYDRSSLQIYYLPEFTIESVHQVYRSDQMTPEYLSIRTEIITQHESKSTQPFTAQGEMFEFITWKWQFQNNIQHLLDYRIITESGEIGLIYLRPDQLIFTNKHRKLYPTKQCPNFMIYRSSAFEHIRVRSCLLCVETHNHCVQQELKYNQLII